ncbi:16S rRNA (guanine(527)-N(7))-methyltransferase RsmG [Acetobacteraceae bacterium ESL0709]|nr:16S rRNA (guanine(527)-N(7))-methyltransferase RsmG [Acetobacteraceae bacterium ESL0697]MDF7677141.1 16S rRNA (guanine(527)-N(7))-methyltransferase RsmG [Acetobacteraceae bacterium ESL0709]
MTSVTVSRETKEKLDRFASLLEQWNSKINLVSPRDMSMLWSRHIEDSLQLVPYISPHSQITDLGSGGGFPGIIIAIATGNPVTLIESDQRKAAFLREAGRLCNARTTIIAQRIEEAKPPLADIVTARALAPLKILLHWSAPLLKENGFCLFLKGQKAGHELTEAQQDWQMNYESFPSVTAPDGVLLKISEIRRV